MITLLLVASALADDPPARPEPADIHPTQCPAIVGVDEGQMIPETIRDGLTGRCAFIALPISDYADHLALSAWADLLEARYLVDTAQLQFGLNWTQAELERLNTPPPFFERPGIQFGAGMGLGAAAIVATVWALNGVTNE